MDEIIVMGLLYFTGVAMALAAVGLTAGAIHLVIETFRS